MLVVGEELGKLEGCSDGCFEGACVGCVDGCSVGARVGARLGLAVGTSVGTLVSPGRVGRDVVVGAAVTGWEVGRVVGCEDGSTATVGKEGALVAPGSVGWEETTEEGCRVGLTRIGDVGAVVGLTGALVGVALGEVEG